MSELIEANWLILSPIILLSVIAVALIIEKGFYFHKIRLVPGSTLSDVLILVGRFPVVNIMRRFPKANISPARELLKLALTSRTRGMPEAHKHRLEALKERYLDRMERHLPILNGIGNIATLLGLFGTVSGMITAFSRMNETGNSDPYVLAGGISQALVSTAAGLAVAIPALLATHLFEALVDRHAEQMDEVISECLFVTGEYHGRTRIPAKPSA